MQWKRDLVNLPISETLSKLAVSASQTLTQLTKVRCVESYSLPASCKAKNLFSWPNTRYTDADMLDFLRDRGVQLEDYHVKSFSVPYSAYEKMTKVGLPEIGLIERTRVALDVFQIVYGGKPVTSVTAAWDTEDSPDRIVPTCLSDIDGLNEFKEHKDSYLIFQREGEKYDIKLKPFALPVVLKRRPELRELEVSKSDLRSFSGDKVDAKARKNRSIVFKANSDYLRRVLNQTNDAVEKALGESDIFKEVDELYPRR